MDENIDYPCYDHSRESMSKMSQNRRPNILFIMSDDHATNGISAYGSRLAQDAPTPNIDRLAKEGIRLDNCHCTNAICTPSRAVILTGKHSHINGVKTLDDHLSSEHTLLPEILQNHGYRTALFGKWHLHSTPRGFDDWAILPGQGLYNDPFFVIPTGSDPTATYLSPNDPSFSKKERNDLDAYHEHGDLVREKGYVTNLITDKTIEWLTQHRDDDDPFFLCCHHKAPHDFFEYDQAHADAYENVEFSEPETLFEDENTLREISRSYGSTVSERWEPRNMVKHLSEPDYPNGQVSFEGLDAQGRTKKAYQCYIRDYMRTVHSIDVNMGRLLDHLDACGLKENTLVIYTSDQGMMLGEHDKIDKRWIFEESQRMPFLARLPGVIPAGSTSDDIIDNTDFAPTLLSLAGIEAPEEMQGRDALSVLKQQTPSDWRQSVYYRYWMHMAHHWVPAHFGIRTNRYKLIFFYGMKLDASGCTHPDCDEKTPAGFELYDLLNDPEEKFNLVHSTEHLSILEGLKQEMMQLKWKVQDGDEPYPELIELEKEFGLLPS